MSVPVAAFAQTAAPDQAALVEFFEKKVRPILANNCFNCHSANTNSQALASCTEQHECPPGRVCTRPSVGSCRLIERALN